MSREDIVAVATRLFAAFLFIIMLRYASSVVMQSSHFSSSKEMTFLLVVTCLPGVGVAALLWFFPLTVARKLLPVMREPRPAINVNSHAALDLTLICLGFWVLSTAIVDSVYWIVHIIILAKQPVLPVGDEQMAGIISTTIELAIGLWLILGSTGLANLVTRFRYAGARQDSDVAP